MELTTIAMEATSIIICLIIMISCVVETEERNNKYKAFLMTDAVTLCALVFDICKYIFDGNKQIDMLLYAFNYIGIIAGMWILTCFAEYMRCFIEDKQGKASAANVKIMLAYDIIVSIAIFVGMVTGHVFTLRHGAFVEGPYYDMAITLLAGPMIYLLVLVVACWKKIGNRDAIAMLVYIMFPTAAVIIELIFDYATLSYIGATLSMLTMYALLQSGEVNTARIKEGIMREYSRTDVLTGLQNRQAYSEDNALIKPSQYGGIVFCDINNLKMINDTKGHEAGDGHIIFFAEMLKDSFGKKYSYRISGDEFVVIMTDVSERVFNDRLEVLKKEVRRHARIASLGHVYGSFRSFGRLLRDAEDMMYEEKRLYYESLK